VTLVDRDGRRLTLLASRVHWEQPGYVVVPGEQGIALDRVIDEETGRILRTTAATARLHVDIGEDIHDRDLSIVIEMTEAKTTEVDEEGSAVGAPGIRKELRWADLSLPFDPLAPLLEMSSRELMEEVSATRFREDASDDYVRGAYDELASIIEDQEREIRSKQQERMATSAFCFVVIVTGAVMAMRLGRQLPLTAYLTSFFPAILALVVISVGQQIGHSAGVTGMILMWGGVIGLGGFGLAAFSGLVRN